ncbi:hypothetical protein [Pseudomonas lundensis]|uniref:hypothetical protein n=1 Tax=Pseudomonas lundensis TaxID=86185 RepID=UPI00117A1043|nr:hypothetical protein [Pseudomonas lundensis]
MIFLPPTVTHALSGYHPLLIQCGSGRATASPYAMTVLVPILLKRLDYHLQRNGAPNTGQRNLRQQTIDLCMPCVMRGRAERNNGLNPVRYFSAVVSKRLPNTY